MNSKFDSTGQTLADNLNTLQSGRVDTLNDMADLHIMARSLIEHEVLRSERKLGKQHPRTRQLQALVMANMAMIDSLQIEREIAQIKVPDIPEQDAWVQGRVRDENARGFGDLTICLVDKEGVPSSELDPMTTDASGHYAVIINKELVSAIAENQHPPLFLGVFSPRNRLVFQSKRPLPIEPGARITEDVTLDRKTLSDRSGPKKPRPGPAPETIAVPDLINLTENDALEKIKSTGLELGDRTEQVVADQVGRVLEQAPVAGTKVKPQSPVHIVVGIAGQVTVPELTGQTLTEAINILQRTNLAVGNVTDRPDDRHDIVLDQKPKKGKEVTAGTAIALVVGRQQDSSEFRAKVVALFTRDERFQDLGISATTLSNRLEAHSINNTEQLKALLEKEDREVRDMMNLLNLQNARTFKAILNKVLPQLD